MIKRIDTYNISDKEKEFLKNRHKEKGNFFFDIFPSKSDKRDEVENSEDYRKYDSEVEEYSYQSFIDRAGETIKDANGTDRENCNSVFGVIVENNPELRKDCVVGSYLAVECFKALMDHAEDYDPNKPDRKLYKIIGEVLGDFQFTRVGKILQSVLLTIYYKRLKSEDSSVFYYGSVLEWKNYMKVVFNPDNLEIYAHLVQVLNIRKFANRLQRIHMLNSIDAPKIIMQNEFRLMYEYLWIACSKIVGYTENFTDMTGYTLDGKFVETLIYEDEEDGDNLPPLAEDQPEYDEYGNAHIYEWNKEDRVWVHVGTVDKF